MWPKQMTPGERNRTLASLKSRLRTILEDANALKVKRSELGTVSRFNIFKRGKLKYQVGNGIAASSKALYDWENDYRNYQECLTLTPFSIFMPWVKLIFGVFSIVLNALLVIDMQANKDP